jgi:protein-S-isoprenylcysteine O-methyltransferase Ste14
MISRTLIFLYALACYALFFVTFLYAIAFVGDFLVPKTIDSGTQGALVPTLIIDLVLLGLFAVQHSVMARRGFKQWWTRIVPKAAERSTYVLATSLALIVLYIFWQPLTGIVWDVPGANGRILLHALFAAGWFIVLTSTFLISHFELFGLQQSFANLRGRPVPDPAFRMPLYYRLVRHPIYFGFALAFWATPTMSYGHLLFAIMTTAYLLIGIALEERDLVAQFGENYRRYRQSVPMLVPFTRLRR